MQHRFCPRILSPLYPHYRISLLRIAVPEKRSYSAFGVVVKKGIVRIDSIESSSETGFTMYRLSRSIVYWKAQDVNPGFQDRRYAAGIGTALSHAGQYCNRPVNSGSMPISSASWEVLLFNKATLRRWLIAKGSCRSK